MASSRDADGVMRPKSHYEAQEQARRCLPELRVHVWAKPEGVCVQADILRYVRPAGWQRESIAYVTFRPREVTEELILQWAMGALSTYLQGKAEASAEAVVHPSQ